MGKSQADTTIKIKKLFLRHADKKFDNVGGSH